MRAPIGAENRRGILNPREAEANFALTRHAPSPDLAAFVERHWIVRWDLRGREPYEQETLPYPCVNLVIGTHRPGLHGVATTRFVARLDDEGWALGTKFRPGGFRPFFRADVCELTDREVALGDAFDRDGAALERAVHAAPGDTERIALVESFLRDREPALDDDLLEAGRIVDLAQSDRSIARVGDLAARAGLTVRALQRLFSSHVGASPKWVIRRFRVHEAAERVAAGLAADWSALVHELGYFDQAHFIRDFKAQVGRTPSEYAALCSGRSAGSDVPTG